MDLPQNLRYTQDHEWLSAAEDTAKVGVTAYAVEQLGDVIHVDLPKPGDSFSAGEACGTIESTKTVSDIYMPVDGVVTAVNAQLESNPELVQSDLISRAGWLRLSSKALCLRTCLALKSMKALFPKIYLSLLAVFVF